MEQIRVGEIHMIEIGEPKQGFIWAVGNRVMGDKYTIVQIVRDDTNFYLFGFVRYLVMVENTKKERSVWREYNDKHKISITYNINS